MRGGEGGKRWREIMNVLTIINNIVGEQCVNMIKFRIHSGVLGTHLAKVSREPKILGQKRTLNNYKKELSN